MRIKFKMEGKKCLTKCPNGRQYKVYSNGCYHDCEYYKKRTKRTKTGGEMECSYRSDKQSSQRTNKIMCREDYLNLRQLQDDIIKTSTQEQLHRFELGLYSLDSIIKDASLNFKQEVENEKGAG